MCIKICDHAVNLFLYAHIFTCIYNYARMN